MKKLLACLALSSGLAVPALAADLPARVARPAPVAYQVPTWSGFYIGGQVGGAVSKSAYTLDNGVGIETFSHDPHSWFGGGHVGLQGQWGDWVLGVEGTYSRTHLESTLMSVLLPGRLRTLTTDAIATVVGKLGIAHARWLLYIKGGAAVADIDTFIINPANGISASSSGYQWGWTFGGGIDYMLTANWIIGVDANYYRIGFDRSTIATDGTPTRWFDTKSEIISATARLSYKFGWDGPVVARY